MGKFYVIKFKNGQYFRESTATGRAAYSIYPHRVCCM